MEGLEQQLLTDLRDRQDRLEEEFHSGRKRTEEMMQSQAKGRAECEALAKWCAACWAKCFELQSLGEMPADLLAEMPTLES